MFDAILFMLKKTNPNSLQVETLLTLGKPTADLGPSCIVGSAAYNLFGITAVCTIAMAPGAP
jgi:hypothetical protein